MPLTAHQVLNAKPGRHSDGRGLYMLVKPSGAKSWVLRVQRNSIRRDYGLGSVARKDAPTDLDIPLTLRRSLTLSEAREKARIGLELAKAGINPVQAWRQVELVVPSFKAAALEYHKQISKAWRNGKHGKQWLATLESYAFPEFGEALVSEIDAPDIQRAILPIWLDKGETARRVRQRVLAVLDYAHGKGWRETEAPARSLDKLMRGVRQPKGGNFEAMPHAELPAFLVGLRGSAESVGKLALQFLILTAARSGEVRKATWSEVDLEAAEWRVPRGNTKTNKLHVVPLVPAALDILKRMQGLIAHKPNEPIFPGNGGKLMSDATLAKALRVAGGEKNTVHGFRSTFRDWAAETGFADAWAEAALAHGNPDKTEAAYKRTTFFAQRRDKLMPAWASYALSDRSNVIALASAGEVGARLG